jgi:hypothetical protein
MKLKHVISTLLLTLVVSAAKADTINFSFAPQDFVDDGSMVWQGSGKNNYLEALIRLWPDATPALESLKGHKVLGVRCYLRTDYKQSAKKFSAISAYQGSLYATPVRKVVDFTAGWNEVMFDEPFVIGDDPLFVGFQVYETQGSLAYPMASYKPASVQGSFYLNLGRTGWTEQTDKGTPLIQAIIEAEPSDLNAPSALAAIHDIPLVVAPADDFDCGLYVKNLSNATITSFTVDNGVKQITYSDCNIEPFGYADIATSLPTADVEGTDVTMQVSVTEINGQPVTPGHVTTSHLYVSGSAYTRVPLIEEFTGQKCVNCPYMFYYLDKALEASEYPYTYVAHHAGFGEDVFTTQTDRDLLYLFGDSSQGFYTFNPAVMYDRTVPSGQVVPVIAAKQSLVEPYATAIEEARLMPGLAKVDLDIDEADGTITVSGRVSSSILLSESPEVYLSAYLVEDGLTTDKYPQYGINVDYDEASPADLKDRFRHNGVIRSVLNSTPVGDLLNVDANGDYSVTFPLPAYGADWIADNCHYVAFVHRINKSDMSDNYVLNSVDSMPFVAGNSAVNEVTINGDVVLKVAVGADRRLLVVSPVKSVSVYTIAGRAVNASEPLAAGVYVVRAVLPGGRTAATKLLVK